MSDSEIRRRLIKDGWHQMPDGTWFQDTSQVDASFILTFAYVFAACCLTFAGYIIYKSYFKDE